MANVQKITPFLWFDNQAWEAADYYISVFKNSKILDVARNGDAVMVVSFSLGGQKFSALNGGPQFKPNPSVSFFVVCETEAETDAVWKALSDGGMALMPLDQYEWSPKYGWVQDRFGVSWQVSQGKLDDTLGQKFSPSLLFTGPQSGKAEAAVQFYTSVFSPSSVTGILKYGPGEPGREGTVKHAQFSLNDETFMAMDNPMDQPFTFNEALSFVVNCKTQEEVDYYWEKLTANGGEESMCGWLKDPFGVSWQIVPEVLPQLLSDPDPAKAQRAMAAMMQMRKIEIGKLTQAPETGKAITVKTTVNAPAAKVWKLWTGAEHIRNWNNASDDWHTPKAVNDLRVGGRFVSTMAAKDGSASFDFEGVYDQVVENRYIAYTIVDGRKVEVKFEEHDGQTEVTETFDAENIHSREMQQAGWQAILDNFKKYAESLTLQFSIGIQAPIEKVYATMIDPPHYAEWTSVFNETSRFEGSWEKGSKIRFLGSDKDGNVGGMVSRIRENIPNEFISIEHLGVISGDQEIISGPEVDGWAGALENYTFRKDNGGTRVLVSMDSNEEFKDYFANTWPKALERLKEICEKG